MLCTVARAALPREYAEVSPLPPSVRTEPLHHEPLSFPSLYPGQTSCRLHLLHTLHQRGGGRGCATPPSLLTSRAGAGAGGVRPGGEQGWQPALLCLARRREELRGFGALLQESCRLQPPRDSSVRSTWEMRPRGGTGVGLAVKAIFHSSGIFWGGITFNELMLTQEVPDTPAPRHPSLFKDSVAAPARGDTNASWIPQACAMQRSPVPGEHLLFVHTNPCAHPDPHYRTQGNGCEPGS